MLYATAALFLIELLKGKKKHNIPEEVIPKPQSNITPLPFSPLASHTFGFPFPSIEGG